MKSFRNNFDVFIIAKYAFLFCCFLIFNSIEQEIFPYSASIFITALCQGASIIFSTALFLSSFIVMGTPGLLGAMGILAGVFSAIIFIYRKTKTKIRFEPVFYALAGLAGFIFLGDTTREILLEKRILVSLFIVILTFLTLISGKAISEKGLKFKLGFEEFISLATVTAVFGLGLSHLISPFLWKGISVFIILAVSYVYKTGICTIISSVLGISLALFYGELNFVAIFLVLSLFSESLCPLSRYVSALGVIVADYLVQVIFGVYPDYSLIDFASVAIGALSFCLCPTFLLKNLKEKLYSFREKQLVRQTINRNRTMLSGRLYDLSGVFTEMANAFSLFKQKGVSEDGAKRVMEKEILIYSCKDCEYSERCKKSQREISLGISKMIDIGFAKGKLSLIDLPKEISAVCFRPNNVLCGLNKLLADYRSRLIENANVESGRDLIAAEARGIAEILQNLALESGELLKYHSRLERTLSDNLFKSGFLISELLIYGEDKRLTVSLITIMKEFSIDALKAIISKTLDMDMDLSFKATISEDKCYLLFKKAADYDAVFGVAGARKDGSVKSGDTHSVMRIENDRFLFALSDGMGSGENAESISSASLALIESFYKAGLNGNLILNTVNKLLSINTEDSFAALDITVLDLKTCYADFIKYGSPYGFIINENGIKIIEGSSLPLGIIDELKPSVANVKLDPGDMILLMSDGISDAFGSSGEVIDFLRKVPAKNPQTLANEILEHAIKLNDGQKKDDMTALAVRIFKRAV